MGCLPNDVSARNRLRKGSIGDDFAIARRTEIVTILNDIEGLCHPFSWSGSGFVSALSGDLRSPRNGFVFTFNRSQGFRSRWLRCLAAKIENPLFSSTWWVRLCIFTCNACFLNASGAHWAPQRHSSRFGTHCPAGGFNFRSWSGSRLSLAPEGHRYSPAWRSGSMGNLSVPIRHRFGQGG